MDGGVPNFVIQNDLGGTAGAGELDPALIDDLTDANSMLSVACRASNDAAVRAHVDFLSVRRGK